MRAHKLHCVAPLSIWSPCDAVPALFLHRVARAAHAAAGPGLPLQASSSQCRHPRACSTGTHVGRRLRQLQRLQQSAENVQLRMIHCALLCSGGRRIPCAAKWLSGVEHQLHAQPCMGSKPEGVSKAFSVLPAALLQHPLLADGVRLLCALQLLHDQHVEPGALLPGRCAVRHGYCAMFVFNNHRWP